MAEVLSTVIIGVIALAVVIVSAETAVKRIIRLVHHFGFSESFAGLTIFSITTSFPEIFAHLVASIGILKGTLDYKVASAAVLGANIGSDVIQQTLLLGLVVLLTGGFVFKKDFLYTAYLPMIGTTLMTLILAWDGTLSRIDGGILIGTYVAYLIFLYQKERQQPDKKKKKREDANVPLEVTIAMSCLAALLVAAHFLLLMTENIVGFTGLGGSLIGVVSLGVVAAAPEFFTAISGVRQKAAGVSLGTLIGSNITNPLVAIGGGALISTYAVPRPLVLWDLPMETITAGILLIYLILNKGKLKKSGGIYLVGLYIVYLLVRMFIFNVD